MGGRGASSATAGKSPRAVSRPMDAADFNQLAQYMQSTHGISIDPSVRNLNFDAAKQGIQGIDNVLNEFPQMAGTIKSVGYDSSTSAYAYATYKFGSNGQLEASLFMSSYFANPQSLRDSLTRDGAFHPKNSDAMQVMAHEAGHALETAMANKASSNIWDAFDIRNKRKLSTRVISNACRQVKKTPYGKGKKNDGLVSAVSGYARKNRSEALAECVGDYIANRSNSNPLSQAVWGILKKEMG